MRPIERINNFLNKTDWAKLEERWGINTPLIRFIKNDYSNYTNLVQYWKSNPDQRIGQVLINLGLIPDKMNIWLDEESDILISQGIAPEECLYWISIMDKDKKLLPHPISRLIKDMSVDHLQAIINDGYRLSDNMKQAFNNVINNAKESLDL